MALAKSRGQRIFTLCALYFAQGVPWGFMLITLPAYLSYQYQVGDDEIGTLTGIILVPWSFKLIWAPIMDSFTIRSMGRRRPWIIGAELMMALTLLGFIGLGDPSEKLRLILWMYFLHNCFASLQDVCTDALAVDILPPDEQGQMNGFMWCSKLVGKGLGAYALSHVLSIGGLEACVGVQVGILLLIMLVPMFILERDGERRFPWSEGEAVGEVLTSIRSPLEVARSCGKAFWMVTTSVYVVFTLVKIIGVGVNEVVTKTLYTQHLSVVWTDIDYARVAGLYATVFIFIAAISGGFLADRFGRRTILVVGFGCYGAGAMLFAASPQMWNEGWFTLSYLLWSETMYAVGSVGFLAMAMRISWTKAAATVFTLFMTLSNVSHVIGNFAAGPVREWLRFGDASPAANMRSYELTFWFVGVVSILPLLLLPFVRPAEVDKARDAEK